MPPYPVPVRVLRVARAQEALLEVEVLAARRQRVELHRESVWRAVEHRRKRLLRSWLTSRARASPPLARAAAVHPSPVSLQAFSL